MIAAVIQPYHTMQGYSMESKEFDKIHQMLQGLENSPGNLQQLNLDGSPDMEIDGRKNPIGGEVIIQDGKYGKKKEQKTLTWIYNNDKSYVQWVRAHIGPSSAAGMQQFRIYVHYRDQAKKLRLQKSSMAQAPIQPKMCSAQRQKHFLDRAQEETAMDWKYDDQMSQHSWEPVIDHQRSMQNWTIMIQGAMTLRTLRLENMKEKMQLVPADQMARMLDNMIHA